MKLEIIYALIAFSGGLASYLQTYLNTWDFHIGRMLAQTLVGMFAGIVCVWFWGILGLKDWVSYAFAGLGAFFGEKSLNKIEKFFNKKYGVSSD